MKIVVSSAMQIRNFFFYYLLYFQTHDMWLRVDARLDQLAARADRRKSAVKKKRLANQLSTFLSELPTPRTLDTCQPKDLLRFLATKDESGVGRTQVHDVECPHLGQPQTQPCGCPCRLSAEYVKHLISDLKIIMTQSGRGDSWDTVSSLGNPAMSPALTTYLSCICDEQAESHVVVKQAKPMTLEKIVSLVAYLTRELDSGLLTLRDTFLFLRDRAFFLVQFLLGERGGDLSKLLIQEIFRCPDESGFILRQTYGKTRVEKHCVLVRSPNKQLCPVIALENLFIGSKEMGLDMSAGYIFRKTLRTGNVINTPMSQSAANQRLQFHLTAIGQYCGETTHSLRSGCAVALQATQHDPAQVASHVGWRSYSSWSHYARAPSFQSTAVAESIASLIGNAGDRDRADTKFRKLSPQSLTRAFP